MSFLSGAGPGARNPAAPPAPTPVAPALPGGRSQLSAGVRIVGEFQAPGHLDLAGQIEGRVVADSVVVEESGEIRGEVQAGAVGIKGTFDGILLGGTVRLHASARVTGTIRYDTLAVESGAEVTAACHRERAGGPSSRPQSEVSVDA